MGEIRVSVDVLEDGEMVFVTIGDSPATASVGLNRYEAIHEALGFWMDDITGASESDNLTEDRGTQSAKPEDHYEL